MNLGIHGLRVYLCILECGSLSAAGRELGMTQPAVSHLHTLEERFGMVNGSCGSDAALPQ